MSNKKMGIYAFLGENGEVLYIGKSLDFKSRMKSHQHLPTECYQEIKEIRAIFVNNESQLNLLESLYIDEEKPKYNQVIPKIHDTNAIKTIPISTWEILDVDIDYMNNKTTGKKLELRITFKENETDLYEYIKSKGNVSKYLKKLAEDQKYREEYILNLYRHGII